MKKPIETTCYAIRFDNGCYYCGSDEMSYEPISMQLYNSKKYGEAVLKGCLSRADCIYCKDFADTADSPAHPTTGEVVQVKQIIYL